MLTDTALKQTPVWNYQSRIQECGTPCPFQGHSVQQAYKVFNTYANLESAAKTQYNPNAPWTMYNVQSALYWYRQG